MSTTCFLGLDTGNQGEPPGAGEWLISSSMVPVPLRLEKVQWLVKSGAKVLAIYTGPMWRNEGWIPWENHVPRRLGQLLAQDPEGLDTDCTPRCEVKRGIFQVPWNEAFPLQPGDVVRLRVRLVVPGRFTAALSGTDLTEPSVTLR